MISILSIFYNCKPKIEYSKYSIPEKPILKKEKPFFKNGDKIGERITILSAPFWRVQELRVEAKNALGEVVFGRKVNEYMKKNLDAAIELLVNEFCDSKCEISIEWHGGYWAYEIIEIGERTTSIGVRKEVELKEVYQSLNEHKTVAFTDENLQNSSLLKNYSANKKCCPYSKDKHHEIKHNLFFLWGEDKAVSDSLILSLNL